MITDPERSRTGKLSWDHSLLLLTLLTLPLFTPAAHPQGCAPCRETIGQTPTATRHAYRRAITVLVIAGTAVFAGSVTLLRRFR